MSLILSFDIGYASIGWCVLSSTDSQADPKFLGTGVVTFPTDDCLASNRRNLRRTRRHIRSTRQRIERMKRWLVHRGVLSRADLDKPGHPAPFLLAAATLQDHRTLDAWELWTVLRWYAHNRGYDGNSRWSREEEEMEDTEKLSNARAYMKGYDSLEELRKALGPNAPESLMPEFHSMAETVCACLELDPAKSKKIISSHLPYKTLNAAYPRATVMREVRILLEKHLGNIPGLDDKTLDLLFTPESLGEEDRELLKAAAIKLPKRYHGGLLFGQLVPRFDNRIISRCPITWAKVYDLVSKGLKGGEAPGEKWHEFVVHASAENCQVDPEKSAAAWERIEQAMVKLIGKGIEKEKAIHQAASITADKFAKVPAAKSKEFLEYRFARILANIKADGKPIDKDLRQQLWELAKKQGRLSHSDIENAVKQHCGDVPTNLEAYFKLHPDSEEALVLDPVMDEVRMAEGSRAMLSPFWKHLTAETRQAVIDEWKFGKAVSLEWIAEREVGNTALADAFRKKIDVLKPKKGEVSYCSLVEYLQATRRKPKIPSGRAPYARPVLRQVVEQVLDGFDPNRSAVEDADANGRKKEKDGVLYDLGIPTSRVRQLQNERPLDQLTNNHLVRHRMLILERLLDDILEEFISKDRSVSRVVVEVARELKEFSGKDRQAIKAAEVAKLAQHKAAEKRLKEKGINPTYSLIRKCRIAMDLNWTCPFTHRTYGESELSELQFEHIIPRSKRLSDSMAGLVLTRPEINALKGNRTARKFVLDHADDDRIVSPDKYKKWVESLRVARRETYPDDYARQHARKRMLMIENYEEKERTFTEGQLTQSSHLMKLAVGAIGRKLELNLIHPIPGPVTAEIRKAWNITGTLALACPEVMAPNETDGNGRPVVRPKNEIRSLTHMHHALDAATIALAAHYFPLQAKGEDQKGRIWRILLKRNRDPQENNFLMGLGGVFERHQNKEGKDKVRLKDLPKQLKKALAHSLAQCRVAQHLPSDRSGAKAELTTWGIAAIEGAGEDTRVKIHQKSCTVENGVRKRTLKKGEERAGKLLGLYPKQGKGKLKAIKGAMVIGENYGLALDPEPTVIPFHDVTARLSVLREANGGGKVRVLRNGMLIRVGNWPGKEGLWRIMSCKASMKLDLARPQNTKASWREVAIASLLTRGLEILPQRYTGHPLTD